jgi:hypothetical protein
VPLLAQTVAGTTTIGCASYTTQPSTNNCPTAAVTLGPGAPGSGPGYGPDSAAGPSGVAPTPPIPSTGVSSAAIPSSIPDGTPPSNPSTGVSSAAIPSSIPDGAPPSNPSTGVSSAAIPSSIPDGAPPSNPSTGVSSAAIPSSIPDGAPPSNPSTEVSSAVIPSPIPDGSPPPNLSEPLPLGETVVTATIGSTVLTETFVPTSLPGYESLASTITTTSLDAQGSPVIILIGPGGIAWTPVDLPSGIPEVPPPTALPLSAGAAPSGTFDAGQASITDAFANTAVTETTIIAGGVTGYWSKATFADLSTITAPTTVTTPVVQTNSDGSQFTISAAVIVVGPGGAW